MDELSARYMRINEAQREEGYGGISAENHFQLALLYLNTNRFSVVKSSHGALYRIPKWSDFAEKHIITMEAESSKNSQTKQTNMRNNANPIEFLREQVPSAAPVEPNCAVHFQGYIIDLFLSDDGVLGLTVEREGNPNNCVDIFVDRNMKVTEV